MADLIQCGLVGSFSSFPIDCCVLLKAISFAVLPSVSISHCLMHSQQAICFNCVSATHRKCTCFASKTIAMNNAFNSTPHTPFIPEPNQRMKRTDEDKTEKQNKTKKYENLYIVKNLVEIILEAMLRFNNRRWINVNGKHTYKFLYIHTFNLMQESTNKSPSIDTNDQSKRWSTEDSFTCLLASYMVFYLTLVFTLFLFHTNTQTHTLSKLYSASICH